MKNHTDLPQQAIHVKQTSKIKVKFNLLFLTLIILQTTMTIFHFNTKSNITNWKIVNDVVMGGKSNSDFTINEDGFGVFKGHVSLENNGGFAMVQYRFDTKKVNDFTKACMTLKGDGKTYQFRIKTNNNDYYSYIAPFSTTGKWQTIEIPFNTMQPAFRGRTLDIGNYPGQQIEMIAFLIGNKKEEIFELQIDTIELK